MVFDCLTRFCFSLWEGSFSLLAKSFLWRMLSVFIWFLFRHLVVVNLNFVFHFGFSLVLLVFFVAGITSFRFGKVFVSWFKRLLYIMEISPLFVVCVDHLMLDFFLGILVNGLRFSFFCLIWTFTILLILIFIRIIPCAVRRLRYVCLCFLLYLFQRGSMFSNNDGSNFSN